MVSDERYPVRVKFSKVGSLKFISHLDLARTVRAAFLRAKLPVWYTMGFNPHPKIVFSLPLSVGTASLCEFMDIMLTERVPFDDVTRRLNAAFPTELRALEAYEPHTRFCDVGWAEYEIRLETSSAAVLASDIKRLFSGSVTVSKTTKAGVKEIDIAPLCDILSCEREGEDIVLRALLSCGENSFVNPKHIVEHITKNLPSAPDGGDCKICRVNVYMPDKTTEFK